eukprot:CAMPEP_0204899554 /NCGR_PEP_ID=MMETSP1397-20131031/1919_1 /ASSEMBLY_ACC=CAM_ASM_000891 /TAXON_ID=49980 /ORGANISM="Climacostomum Climacostomum virens, Strain Stock W-24" /LENGTH=411 /DNA_ID=CAMNT_0052067527 /DNA_START=494 /DNA_END=1729 /DNA_ORIENTATION=+
MEDFLRTLKVSNFLVETIKALNLATPTQVQLENIPKILNSEAVRAKSPTGTGKTAAFAIPIIEMLSRDPYGVFALVLTPTRELALQIEQQFQAFGSGMSIKTECAVGGHDIIKQSQRLYTRIPHVVIATPGRLAYLLDNEEIRRIFQSLRFIVFDESDYLQEELQSEVNDILSALPPCSHLHFSATLDDVSNVGSRAKLTELYMLVPEAVKDIYLIRLLARFKESSCIVFTDTCEHAEMLHQLLVHYECESIALHSLLTQHERTDNLQKFRSARASVLIATDVASRGLDLPQVSLVINHNVPRSSKLYLHRVGRTARAGRPGTALTLVTQFEVNLVLNIENKLETKLTEYCTDKEMRELEDEVMDWLGKVTNAKALLMHRLQYSGFTDKAVERKKRKALLGSKLRKVRKIE